MEPKKHTTRGGLQVRDVNDTPEDVFMDSFLEDGDINFNNIKEVEKTIDEQELRIKALNLAINIAKLMSNVTTEDVIKIADDVLDYLQNTEI